MDMDGILSPHIEKDRHKDKKSYDKSYRQRPEVKAREEKRQAKRNKSYNGRPDRNRRFKDRDITWLRSLYSNLFEGKRLIGKRLDFAIEDTMLLKEADAALRRIAKLRDRGSITDEEARERINDKLERLTPNHIKDLPT